MALTSQQECLLVSGYTKQWMIDHIPTDITQYILLWFGSSRDKWDKQSVSKNIMICGDSDGMIIKRIYKWDGYHYNAFGYQYIGHGQCKTWKLRIIQTKPRFSSCIQFGIIERQRVHSEMKGSFCQMTHYNGYGAYAKNGRLFHGSYYPHSNKFKRIPAVTTNDQITITADFTSKDKESGQLMYNINDSKTTYLAFRNIDSSQGQLYQLAVAVYTLHDAVLLLQ